MLGTIPFLVSGAVALAVFWFYADILARLGRERFREVRIRVLAGALAIFAVMNLCYFAKILPPLPLALADAGVYHSVKKVGTVYQVMEETQPWTTFLGVPPIQRLAPGDKLYLYSSVFAPARVSTGIVHHWEWYDPTARRWEPQSRVVFSINGGRDGGYRVYSVKSRPKPGDWRVNIATVDGRQLGRIRFAVAAQAPLEPLLARTLN
jgi:hypothetical protein